MTNTITNTDRRIKFNKETSPVPTKLSKRKGRQYKLDQRLSKKEKAYCLYGLTVGDGYYDMETSKIIMPIDKIHDDYLIEKMLRKFRFKFEYINNEYHIMCPSIRQYATANRMWKFNGNKYASKYVTQRLKKSALLLIFEYKAFIDSDDNLYINMSHLDRQSAIKLLAGLNKHEIEGKVISDEEEKTHKVYLHNQEEVINIIQSYRDFYHL